MKADPADNTPPPECAPGDGVAIPIEVVKRKRTGRPSDARTPRLSKPIQPHLTLSRSSSVLRSPCQRCRQHAPAPALVRPSDGAAIPVAVVKPRPTPPPSACPPDPADCGNFHQARVARSLGPADACIWHPAPIRPRRSPPEARRGPFPGRSRKHHPINPPLSFTFALFQGNSPYPACYAPAPFRQRCELYNPRKQEGVVVSTVVILSQMPP